MSVHRPPSSCSRFAWRWGAANPVVATGRFTRAGFDVHLSGNASLERLRAFSKRLALFSAGNALLNLDVRGKWLLPIPDSENPVASSTTEGSLLIRNAELNTSYLAQPVRIVTAQAILSPTQIAWTNASLSYGKLAAQGTLEYPTLCTSITPCPTRFTFDTEVLDAGGLQSALLGTSQPGELLRQLLDRIGRHPAPWPTLSGSVHVGTLSAGKLAVHDATGTIDISGNAIVIHSLNGALAEGSMHLAGTIDAAGDQPQYRMDVQVTNAAPNAFATMFGEHWGTGITNVSLQLQMAGFDTQDLVQSATGELHWDWTRGGLATDEPLPAAAHALGRFDQWTAEAVIADRTITISHSLLTQGQEAMPVSGKISFDRVLALAGGSPANAFTVTGTLQHPEVKATTEETEK